MTVFRRYHTSNFTTISNRLFDDERLSADEVGILSYLLSRPQDWEVRRPALMRRWSIGIVAMKRIVHSWMRTGWCQAKKVRLPNGQFYIEYQIYDLPGRGMSDDEIREALSLVSSEALNDESPSISADDHPRATDQPPPCQPPLADQPVATDGWPIKDNTNNGLPRTDSTQKPEREGARAREKHALNLVEFKRRWPTNASDDQRRVDNAFWALSNEEGEDCLAGIAPFLENQKRLGRKHPPAGFTFIEQKRWTLLGQAKAETPSMAQYPLASREGRAVAKLYEIAGATDVFFRIVCRAGIVYTKIEMTPQMLALADLPQPHEWKHIATHQECGAWKRFAGERIGNIPMNRLVEGGSVPRPFPPKVDGTWSPTGPPGPTEDDLNTLADEASHR